MDGPFSLYASLHLASALPPGAAEALAAGLLPAGVVVAQGTASVHPDQPAILLFSSWDQQAAGTLDALTPVTAGGVLAVCCASTPLPPGACWAVLDAGAADILQWPDAPGAAEAIAPQAAARLRRWADVRQLMQLEPVRSTMVGDSAAWRTLVRSVVEVAAWTSSPVLITGETGTGKEQIARLIHTLNGRGAAGLCSDGSTAFSTSVSTVVSSNVSSGGPTFCSTNGSIGQVDGGQAPLVLLDCSTLSPELAGSEFFGHERGAYTGATAARDGAFAQADGGILFLDEVGELPLPLQAQLLRVIQEQQYKRLGGNHWQPTRFRLVCATNRDLDACVAAGAFRADLFYRIAAWRCHAPSLRDRPGDVLPLVTHFLQQLDPRTSHELDPAVRQYLLTRDYPGNVRDLRQTVARIWHRHCGPGPLTVGDIPPEERLHGETQWPDLEFAAAVRHALDLGVSLPMISQAAGDTAMRLALADEQGNNQRAAARLGISDRALQMRRKGKPDGPAYH